ncbi:MAG: ABC transporter ATP-binding protein [Negativicutes bacterium]|nr:ABC transporter ATP-binding protein [Negativicutes bacterium]
MLKVEQVSKEFRGLRALHNVSFAVDAGKITGLIGPNGAGKTTMFNVISGFFRPTSGKVLFAGRDVTILEPYERCRLGLARTFQIMKPLPYMSVLDNVIAGCMFGRRGCSNLGEARETALEILEFTDLTKRNDVLAKELGTADKKRLELARALGTKPELLLLDEVMSGLNHTESEQCVQLIRKINQTGVTVLLIEHVMQAVVNLCEKIIVLHHGEKIAEGSAAEVMNNELVIEVYLGKEEEHAQA